MDKVLIVLGAGFVFWCIGDAIVRIIRTSKSSAMSAKVSERMDELEADLADVEQELEGARRRIEVLEKILGESDTNQQKPAARG